MNTLTTYIRRAGSIHDVLARSMGDPNRVWCRKCGNSKTVDAAACLAKGWPKCCGQTMTIDKPERER